MSGDPFAGRVTQLNDHPVRDGAYVLYWMQNSQRAGWNHALEYTVNLANERGVPPLVCFGLTADYPDASARHYRFMLEGLRDVEAGLRTRGIPFVLRMGDPAAVALDLGRDAAAIVCDRGYLRHLREWRFRVGRTARCRVIEVESDLVIPVERASTKREYAARTIRPRIHRVLGDYLVALPMIEPGKRLRTVPKGESVERIDDIMALLAPAADPAPVPRFFVGGEAEAMRRLERFRTLRLDRYEIDRSEPAADVASTLSPYLHFGQISELRIALEMGADRYVDGLAQGKATMSHQPGSVGMRTDDDPRASARDAFLEELLVRRGLAHNFVWYSRDYDAYAALPEWTRATLRAHAGDARAVVYAEAQLVAARTHDEYWNAAMTEMILTGAMQNYMRMYWGKKILEWSATPEEAFATTLRLNNRYFLDGRDPNSYANVGWIFGLHDRPWTEREVFGTVRYMNSKGLERKFYMAAYLLKVDALKEKGPSTGP